MKRVILGLTGPIGSGKNKVSEILVRHGARIIDADQIGHKIMSPNTEVWRKLVKIFGLKILSPSGRINRKKLASLVFSFSRQLEILNKITHPAILAEIKNIIQGFKDHRLIVINAALLQQIGLDKISDIIWAVLASKNERIRRLQRKGMSKMEIKQRINSQARDSAYAKSADYVIKNNAGLQDLRKKVEKLLLNSKNFASFL